jgi:hypothetical protein
VQLLIDASIVCVCCASSLFFLRLRLRLPWNLNLVYLLHAVMVHLLKAILSVLVFYGTKFPRLPYRHTHYCAALPASINRNYVSSLATEDVGDSLDKLCGA